MLASANDYELHFDADWFMWPELVADGALMPLNDLLPRHAPALYEHYRDVGALEDVTVDGRILGLPATEFGTGRAWAVVNAEWYEAFGANEPLSSMEQVVELMEYVDRHVESIDYPLDQIWGSNPVNENAMWAMYTKHDLDRAFAEGNHGFIYDLRQAHEAGEVEIVAVQETEAYREAAQWRRTFHERGWIPRDAMHDEGETYRFHHGRSAVTIRGLRDQFMATSEGVRIEGFMMYPDSYAAFSGFMRNGLAMNRNAANPELALAFLEWMYESQANYDLVMYGIDGTTYELARENGQEVVRHTAGRGPADGYPHWHGRWGFWRLDRIRAGVADGDPELYSEAIPTAREHPTNVTSPLAGFQFDPSQVRSEIALRKSLLEEHEPPITHGLEADVDRAIEHLREILNEAGAEVIRTELQRQVDEFLGAG